MSRGISRSSFSRTLVLPVLAFLVQAGACASAPPGDEILDGPYQPDSVGARIDAVGWDGNAVLIAEETADGSCAIERVSESGDRERMFVTRCPTRIDVTAEGDLLFRDGLDGWVHHRSGALIAEHVLSWNDLKTNIVSNDGVVTWNTADGETPLPGVVAAALLPGGEEAVVVRRNAEGDRVIRLRREPFEAKALSSLEGRFEAWDLAEDGEEAIVVVRGEKGADAGIMSTSRPALNWIPDGDDALSMPRWAPRGYKVSVLVDGARQVIRSTHVPTAAMQYLVPHGTRVQSYAWNADGERIAVVSRSLLAADSVDVLTYRSDPVASIVPSRTSFEGDSVVLADGKTLLVKPSSIHYGSRYPVVVVVAPDKFDPALAELANGGGIGVAFTGNGNGVLEAIRGVSWIDPASLYVYAPGSCADVRAEMLSAARLAVDSRGALCRGSKVSGESGIEVIRRALQSEAHR